MENQTNSLIADTLNQFKNTFQVHPEIYVTAPGRVNLIGEHTDYNQGFVLPAAINKTIVIAASPRKDHALSIYSGNYQSHVQVSLHKLQTTNENFWANYIKGVAFFLQESGAKLSGANLYVHGDIPPAAGLSSSAALEMAAAFTFLALNDLEYDSDDIIKLCHKAENQFVGVQCGIMDQFVCCSGKKNHSLFLDCRSLSFTHVPISDAVKLIVCDTGVKRKLADSEYNLRRQECNSGYRQLSKALPNINSLRDVSLQQLQQQQHALHPTYWKRCHHVISENLRVLEAVQALKKGDVKTFGSLMYQSHFSLKNDFEVSCVELDTIVDICAECEGVLGARMTGAGFGGCAICLVQNDFVPDVIARLSLEYPKNTGITPRIYVCSIEDGVKITRIEEQR